MTVLLSHGAYVPPYCIDRETISRQHGRGSSSGTTAVPARDENVLTLACEATERALDRCPVDGEDLVAVLSASVTDPFAEHGLASHLAYRFGTASMVRTADFRGSARAAGDAFAAAESLCQSRNGPVLVAGTDSFPAKRGHQNEPYAGAGAAAFIVASGADSSEARVVGRAEYTSGFVEFPRRHGQLYETGDGRFERKWGFGKAVEQLFGNLRETHDAPEALVVQARDPRFGRRALRDCHDDTTLISSFPEVGWAGTASFFLDLVRWLEDDNTDAGDTGWAISYGAGGADAFVLRATSTTAVDQHPDSLDDLLSARETVQYAQHLGFREHSYQPEVD